MSTSIPYLVVFATVSNVRNQPANPSMSNHSAIVIRSSCSALCGFRHVGSNDAPKGSTVVRMRVANG